MATGQKGMMLELVGDGLSFATSLTLDPTGTIYVAESGLPFGGAPPGGRIWRLQRDGSRSSLAERLRPPVNAPDLLFEIQEGAWYGWPDFIGGDPVTDDRFRPERGPTPTFVLANHSELPPPPKPLLRFPPHGAALKFDVAPSETEWAGQIVVALFGDEAPMTAPAGPRVGRSVVRIDSKDWSLHPVRSEGLHRPIDVRFGPSGALYILDFGYFEVDAGRGLIARKQSGKLWRCQMPTKEE